MRNWGEDEEDEENLDEDELKRQIVASLQYLIAEGMVVQEGDRYRLKTKKEINKELKAIEKGKNVKL